ncbi:MAG TPA: hypothetical protein VL022_05780 [Moheibacter sp.]|nr:hypothetical protein [Moheibacter sp.]
MMVVSLFYVFKPYVIGFDTIWENYNFALIFMGLGISFSTLQDPTKTQNKASRKVWGNPKKGKIALLCISILAFLLVLIGFFGVYFSELEALQQLSFGIIALGIGQFGLLKVALEIFEDHRLDKNPRIDIP